MIPIYPEISVLIMLPVETMTYPCGIDIALVNGKRYHHCEECRGWIEGDVITIPKDMGTAYYCRRLGHELGFVGYYV